jgi:hypothetical protein
VATAFQSNAFQNNAFQIDIAVTTAGGAFGKKYPDRRHHYEWTREELELAQEALKRARERSEQERRDKAQAERDRYQELIALYEQVTGEAKPVLPAKLTKAKVSKTAKAMEAKRRNLEIERQIAAELRRIEDELDDEEALIMLAF